MVARITNFAELDRHIRSALRHWCDYGHVTQIELHEVRDFDAINLRIVFRRRASVHYRITHHELAMGGIEAINYWLHVVDSEINRYVRENETPIQNFNLTATEVRMRQDQYGRRLQEFAEQRINEALIAEFGRWDHNIEAEKKAQELFKQVAGMEAFARLDSGKPLVIRGSHTKDKYLLFKRSTYCVEKPENQIKLCAVVPGVPLWDHLLGIKLMVEHDEPTFLKTANVSGGQRAYFSNVHDPLTWR